MTKHHGPARLALHYMYSRGVDPRRCIADVDEKVIEGQPPTASAMDQPKKP